MTEVALFGWLIATLASAASVFFLVMALGSAAFLALVAARALEERFAHEASRSLEAGPWDPPRVRRAVLIAGGFWALVALGFGVAGLRVGGAFLTGVVIGAGSLAVFGAAALGTLLGLRGVSVLVVARRRRIAMLRDAEKERARLLDESRRRHLEGADIREQVADAEGALLRLRAALRSLKDMKLALDEKLEAISNSANNNVDTNTNTNINTNINTKSMADEYARLRDAIGAKLDLGARILSAAEIAVFRLACFEPLRRLLRRRPHEATAGLSRARTASELAACIDRAIDEIQTFLGELDGGRAVLDALADRRPEASVEGASDDPLKLARAEIDAVEAAYHAVLERAGVVRAKIMARAGMEQVTRAVGALSESARGTALDDGELRLLLDEVARAESAMSITAPSNGDVRGLTEALVRSAAALDTAGAGDSVSLDELVKAMREIG
ncbi:MAG: hypothetical protein HUU21_29570 [Polyangiaceae bacterium]|nr:hypothetical protein [Polyangiaceae bacterium]